MAVDIKRFSTVRSCRSLLREIPFQRDGPSRRIRSLEGGITPTAPQTRLLVQTSTGPAQRGLRHLLTALCSTMPTTSSSSRPDSDVRGFLAALPTGQRAGSGPSGRSHPGGWLDAYHSV